MKIETLTEFPINTKQYAIRYYDNDVACQEPKPKSKNENQHKEDELWIEVNAWTAL